MVICRTKLRINSHEMTPCRRFAVPKCRGRSPHDLTRHLCTKRNTTFITGKVPVTETPKKGDSREEHGERTTFMDSRLKAVGCCEGYSSVLAVDKNVWGPVGVGGLTDSRKEILWKYPKRRLPNDFATEESHFWTPKIRAPSTECLRNG